MSTLCLVQGSHSKVGRPQVKSVFRVSMLALSRQTLCNPIDCSPPGSSAHGISQTRTPEGFSLTQGSNLGLLCSMWMALSLSHPIKEWANFCFGQLLDLLCFQFASAQRPGRHQTQQKFCSYSDMTQGSFLLSNAIYSFHFSFCLYKYFSGNLKLSGPNCRPGAI